MGRRAHRRRDDHVPLRSAASSGRVESGPDGDWIVRQVTGAAADRAYRCPGCDQVVGAGTPHVVAWPAGNVEDRRHWHTPCWAARTRRRPGGRRR
jgi:hypothetical protein